MSDKPDINPKDIAAAASTFMASAAGIQFMTAMNAKYNDWHHKAEQDNLSAEQKAFYVERAAGIKSAMDWFMNRKVQSEGGYFDKK